MPNLILPDNQSNIVQLRKLFLAELNSDDSKVRKTKGILQPLSPSHDNISLPYTSKHKSSDINVIDLAIKTVEFSLNQLNSNISSNEKANLFSICSLAFATLKSSDIDKIDLIRKQQVLIIRCITLQKYEYALNEIWEVYKSLDRLIYESTNLGQTYSPIMDKLDHKRLFKGLPYTKSSDSFTQMVVSFHILLLQVIYNQLLKNKEKAVNSQSIIKIFSNDSNHMKWVKSLPSTIVNTKLKAYSKLASSFSKQISSVLKISFLIKALELDLSEEIGSQLLESFEIMYSKNAKVVYQFTAPVLYESIQVVPQLRTSYIFSKIMKQFQQYKTDFHTTDPYNWFCEPNRDLLSLLDDISYGKIDHVGINEAFESQDLSYRFDNTTFLVSINKSVSFIISNYTFLDLDSRSRSRHILTNILTYFETSFEDELNKLGGAHLAVLDPITVFVKSLSAETDTEFINSCLKSLFNIMKSARQFKRIRNLSNLYYNFGSKLLNGNFEGTYAYWLRSIRFEEFILNNDAQEKIEENLSVMKMKIERISNSLVENNLLGHAKDFIDKFLITYDQKLSNESFWYKYSRFHMPLLIQLFTKIIIADEAHAKLSPLFSDQLKTILFVNFLKFLEKSGNIETKTNVINYFLEKLELVDNGLYLLCLYKYYDTNGIKYINVDLTNDFTESCIEDYKDLLLSALNLQVCINQSYDQTYLLESISEFQIWLLSTTESNPEFPPEILQIEAEIFENLINFLNYQGLVVYVVYLLKLYRSKRNLQHDKFELFIELQLCEANMTLLFPKQISNTLTSTGLLMKSLELSSNEIISWKLLQFEYCLLIGNLTHGKEKFQTILTFLKDNNDFDIFSQNNLSMNRKFENLVILGKFQYLTSILNFELNNYVDSITNAKKAIKILHSVMKKIGNNFPKPKYNQIKWNITRLMTKCLKHMIGLFAHLGMTRDCEYYSEELSNLNDANKFPINNCSIYYFLTEYKLLSAQLQEANQLLIAGDKIFTDLSFIDKFIEMENYSIHLLYFRMINDETNEEIYNSKIEEFFDSLVENSVDELANNLTNLKINDEVLKMFKLSEDEFQLFSRLKLKIDSKKLLVLNDSTQFPNNKLTKQKFHFYYDLVLNNIIKSKKHLFEAKLALSKDPSLSILNDSAMSLPAITSQSDSPKKGTATISCNAKKAIAESNLSKELLLNCAKKAKLSCKNYELHDLTKTFSNSLSLLSGISSIDSSYLKELYYMEEVPRYLPFVYEKLANGVTDGVGELLPNSELAVNHTNILESSSELFDLLRESLPNNWMVVSIDVCPFNGDLLLTKFDTRYETPFVTRLPLNRHSSRDVDEESFSFSDAMDELRNIIKESDATTKVERTSKIVTKEDRKLWWKERFELDLRLQKLLRDVEYCWLGGFGGIFNLQRTDKKLFSQFKASFLKLLESSLPSRKSVRKNARAPLKNNRRLSGSAAMYLGGDYLELEDRILELFIGLGHPSKLEKTELLEDLIYFALDVLLFHGEPNAYDEIDIDQMYVELEECLITYHSDYEASHNQERFQHVVLVPGNHCAFFPWESLPSLRNCPITRMPSLKLLLDNLISKDAVVSPSDGYFILNPGGDLERTEANFGQHFETLGWSGIVGQKPTEEEMQAGLQTDLFIYIGHGGGEQYIRSNALKQMNNIAPSLLLGCSSGVLKDNGLFEPYGTVYSYLIGGSPMVLANMWDVTDKDIDKFSISVLEKWGLFSPAGSARLNISEAVVESRGECNLQFLNGAAPVIYGLPLALS